MQELLHDIGITIISATALGLIAHWLRQPIILGYLIAGALIGPTMGFGLVSGEENIHIISEIGLILLLFIIGLELDIKQIIASGRQLLVAGFGQFPVCAVLGVGFFWMLGYGLGGRTSDGLYLALMCGMSSTAVVVKLLYDKAELDTLPGRMTLGILVIQDIFAIFILAFQPNFASPSPGPILMALLNTGLLLAGGFLFSAYILKYVFATIARSPEMVVGVSIGWCAAVAALASYLGLSSEMGALLAGLSVSAFPYSHHIIAKSLPLRDFFLTLFFVSLGMQIIPLRGSMIGLVAILVGFVIVSRFVSVYPLLKFSGAGRRTAFIASLNLAQISEFSLVIASLGVSKFQHISNDTVAATIYAMAITAVLSSYTIRYNHGLFLLWNRLLTRLGKPIPESQESAAGGAHDHPIVILGFHRTARALIDLLYRSYPTLLDQLLVVDFNPENLEELKNRNIAAAFGDISSADSLEQAHLRHSRLIICTIPDMLLKGTDNQTLARTCKNLAPQAQVVVMSENAEHSAQLIGAGAEQAVNPHELIADQFLALIKDTTRYAPAHSHATPKDAAKLAV